MGEHDECKCCCEDNETLRTRVKGLEAALRFEKEIVRTDKNAEIARLELRLAERENEIRKWSRRSGALARKGGP